MKVAVLFSGGKDSVMATYWAIQQGHEISCLITLFSEREDSYMFHIPNIKLTKLQAKAMQTPQLTATTSGIKEQELEDLKIITKKAIKKYKIQGIVTGALASNYQKTRVEKICKELKLKCFAPYWHYDQEEYIKKIINSKFKVIITGVFAEGLTKELLGKELDKLLLEKLKEANKKYKIHLSGEGGEYETFVIDGPIFKKKIKVIDSETKEDIFIIKKALLKEK